MTRDRVQQAWRRFKAWWMRFFGVEAPEEETQPSPEYVRGYWNGYADSEASMERLMGVLQRIAKGQE